MPIQINETAEQFIAKVIKSFVNSHGGKPQNLIAQTIAELYPNMDGSMVRAQLLENSVQRRIDEAERQQISNENEFEKIGQLGLFGSGEHQMPTAMMGKSTEEACAWMRERAAIERQNAEEMAQAAEAQRRRSDKFARWAAESAKLRLGVIESGWDPEVITYAEAVKRAQAFQHGNAPNTEPQTERPVR